MFLLPDRSIPKAAFFQRLGVFAVNEFLDSDLCHNIRAEMRRSQSTKPAKIVDNEGADRVDETVRKVMQVNVSDASDCLVKQQLNNIRPKIEAHFGMQLGDCENPQFLAYQEGDFFKPHTDSNSSPTACGYQLNRRVSLVLFLNGESSAAEPNGYAGGSLTFYGLLKQPPWEKCGFNIQGETGLLVAFASDVYHEVTPVTEGMRFTMVTWFPLHQEMG